MNTKPRSPIEVLYVKQAVWLEPTSANNGCYLSEAIFLGLDFDVIPRSYSCWQTFTFFTNLAYLS
jgi:hypothetical protein